MNQLDLTCPACAEALAAYERWLVGGEVPNLLWIDGEPDGRGSHIHLSEAGGMIIAGAVTRLMARAAVQAAAGRNFAEGLAQGTRYLQEELGKAYDAGIAEGERRARAASGARHPPPRDERWMVCRDGAAWILTIDSPEWAARRGYTVVQRGLTHDTAQILAVALAGGLREDEEGEREHPAVRRVRATTEPSE